MFFTIGIQCKQYPLGFMCKRGQNSPSLPLTVLRIQYNHLTPLFLDYIYCFLLLSAYYMSLYYSPNHKAKDLQTVFFFLFWHNFRLTEKLQEQYKKFSGTLYSDSPNVNISPHLLCPSPSSFSPLWWSKILLTINPKRWQ